MKSREQILAEKQNLADTALVVAKDALEDLTVMMEDESSVRDLLNIFNSAVKAHRELTSDLLSSREAESEAEAKLANQYTSKVKEILEGFKK